MGIGYAGTRGASLDIQRAPNRGANGVAIADVQPFIWEESGGHSIMHAFSVRLQKRPSKGIGAGASYTLSKSRDNASTLGGGGGTVAQNDKDLEAEWGASSFDQRHRLPATSTSSCRSGGTGAGCRQASATRSSAAGTGP